MKEVKQTKRKTSTTTKASKRSSEKKDSPAKSKKTSVEQTRSIAWQGVEARPRRNWWWWLRFIFWMSFAILVAYAIGNWSFAVLLGIIMVAIIVLYGGKAPIHRYEINGDTVKVDGATLKLEAYNRCCLETRQIDDAAESEILTLLPVKYFGLPLSIPLPREDDQALEILELVASRVPFNEDDDYQKAMRPIERVVRWMRLG